MPASVSSGFTAPGGTKVGITKATFAIERVIPMASRADIKGLRAEFRAGRGVATPKCVLGCGKGMMSTLDIKVFRWAVNLIRGVYGLGLGHEMIRSTPDFVSSKGQSTEIDM